MADSTIMPISISMVLSLSSCWSNCLALSKPPGNIVFCATVFGHRENLLCYSIFYHFTEQEKAVLSEMRLACCIL